MVFCGYSNAVGYIVPDSPDKDQVETFIPAVYSTHYCASPSLQRSKLDPYHTSSLGI